MLINEETERKQLFQQVMSGCADDFLEWAGHFFYNEAKIRLVQMPWDKEHPTMQYASAPTSSKKPINDKVEPPIEVLGINKHNPLGVSKHSPWSSIKHKVATAKIKPGPIWLHIDIAPKVKKKAYNSVGLKLKPGMHIKAHDALVGECQAVVLNCTKHYVKIKKCLNNDPTGTFGNPYHISYTSVTHVAA